MKAEIKQRIERIKLGEVPEGYRKTKLGIAPMEWEEKRLEDITTKIGSGKTPLGGEKVYQENGIPFIRSQNVLFGKLDLAEVAFISENEHYQMKSSQIKPCDVLLNITGASIGRCCLVPSNFESGNLNQHVCIIRLMKNINKNYVVSFLLSENFGQKQIQIFQAGGNREGLNFQQVGGIRLALPPLAEQEKIAEILSTWDKAIELKEKYIQCLENRKKGLMQNLLSGTIRLSGFSEEWNEFRLKTLIVETNNRNKEMSTEKVYSISNKSGFIPQEEQFDKIVASKDITNYQIISKGCIAYNPSRINVGSIALFNLDFDVVVSPMYVVFKCKENLLLTDYMYHWINSHTFDQQMKVLLSGSVRDSLNFSDLGLIKINLPSLKEQKAIIQVLSLADLEISLQKAELETLRLQKKGLMQVLLTGKVRVAI